MLGNQNDLGRKRFCTKCGHQNNISQRYCIKCGKDFDPVNTRKANPVQPQAQSAQYQENPSAPIYPQPVQTQYYPPTHPQTQFSYATQYCQPSNTNRSLNRPPLTWEGPDRILPAFIYILRKPGKHVAQLLEGNNWPDATRVIFLFSLSCAVFLYHIVSIEIPFSPETGT